MLDITPDDISQLNDTDLRELVGRLCEAELANHGLSPAAVTWGAARRRRMAVWTRGWLCLRA